MEQDKSRRKSRSGLKSPAKVESIFLPKNMNTFWILLKDQKNKKPEYEATYAGDYFYRISLSTGKEQLIKCYFELNDNFLFCYKEQSKSLVAYLDLEYARIKEIKHKEAATGEEYYGIRIIRHRNYEDLLSKDIGLVKKWFDLLKRYCIMSQFGLFYENIKVLGQGNFAKVFLVKRKADEKEFAAKVFDKKAILSDPLEKKCLIYEINTLRSLNHKNVMKTYELYEGQNYIYCVLEPYYGGQLLKKILKKGRFSEGDSIEILFRILNGLAYLEKKDIIHRDLKPENVIFRSKHDQHEVVLVDFGFATKVVDYKKLFTRCGTPGYVAPEVLNDQEYNCKADVFSAGIIFYILLTGCAPFYGESYDDVVERNLKADLNYNFQEINLTLQDSTMDLLKSLLMKDPKKRISASQALKHEAFKNIDDKLNEEDDLEVADNNTMHHLKDFHDKYKFEIKKFPKAKIPDSISDLNTPMLSADHRVIKRMKNMPGITPHLTGRKLDSGNVKRLDIFARKNLKEIKEEDEGRQAKRTKNALRNLKGFL